MFLLKRAACIAALFIRLNTLVAVILFNGSRMSLEGLEPSWVLPRRILSPLRLPIPPQALERESRSEYPEKILSYL